jgi:putative flippase GtrA
MELTPPPQRPAAVRGAGPRRPGLFGPASVGRYGLIGVSGVTLDTVLFVALTAAGVPPVPATVTSTLAGIVNNYVLNARLNFGTSLNLSSGARFITVGLIGLGVAAVSLHLLIEVAGLSPLAAKLVSVPVVVAAQFVANKHWSFRGA